MLQSAYLRQAVDNAEGPGEKDHNTTASVGRIHRKRSSYGQVPFK